MRRAGFWMACGVVLALGQGPPKVFELQVPEFQDKVFEGDIVELPVHDLAKLVIHVLNPVADSVSYGRIYPKLNGDAASIVCQYRSTARGKALWMDLRMRPDLRLKPGANVLEITAVNQRGRRYYRNWTLRTRAQARNEWFAYDFSLAPGEEHQAPPDLQLFEPEFPVVLQKGETRRQVRIRGAVSAVHPLRTISVNGEAVAPPKADPAAFEAEVSVSPKDTQIVAEAADHQGNRTRITIPVLPATGPAKPKPSGDRYALIVGISRYRASVGGPPPAQAAAADAESLAAALTGQAGFRQDRVLLLRDERADAAQVRNAFRNFIAIAKPDDLLLIYFAGHGVHDPTNPEKMYLACHDTQMRLLADTAIALEDLENLLSANTRSRHVMLLFDVARETPEDWRIPGSNLVNSYLLRLHSKEAGRTVMVSAGIGEISRERQREDRFSGLFTGWMIEALEGKADWNRDHLLTVAEVFRFVSDRVRQETGGAQTPRYQIAELDLPVVMQGR